MRVFFRKEFQAIIKLLQKLKALLIACVHGGSLKAHRNQAIGKTRQKAWRVAQNCPYTFYLAAAFGEKVGL
jgi:hypothetical protein